jgi:UDP-N-acetylglucosamine--dolichyl-phosphate N-acetylglucosaminephosphotransferase
LLPGAADALPLALSFFIPFLMIVLLMRPYLKMLMRRGMTVDDVHKPGGTKVPSPTGPLLASGLIAGELVVSAAFHTIFPLAVAGVTAIAFAVGLADDLFVLGGKTKPLLLVLASVPLIIPFLDGQPTYSSRLYFPILGSTGEHFTIYTLIVVAAVPIVSNAFNMMDSFNGEISGFTLMTSLAIALAMLLKSFAIAGYPLAHLESALPLVAASLGFYIFNRYPSRAFDGDSGSLAFGACFVALAVTGGVEIAAVVAIIPAILNSFYILSSVRGFVERRRMAARPTSMGEDGRLYASENGSAPTTLVRMILLDGPMTERELVRAVLVLTAASCILSVLTSYLTWMV